MAGHYSNENHRSPVVLFISERNISNFEQSSHSLLIHVNDLHFTLFARTIVSVSRYINSVHKYIGLVNSGASYHFPLEMKKIISSIFVGI